MAIHALHLAGIILLCITAANVFAPKKMRWTENLAKTELVFRQVFIIHCVFLLACVMGMALLCLIKPVWLLEDGLGRALAGFNALFWVARVLVQVFYYEKSIKREFPFFNVLFTVVFCYLAIVFTATFFHWI